MLVDAKKGCWVSRCGPAYLGVHGGRSLVDRKPRPEERSISHVRPCRGFGRLEVQGKSVAGMYVQGAVGGLRMSCSSIRDGPLRGLGQRGVSLVIPSFALDLFWTKQDKTVDRGPVVPPSWSGSSRSRTDNCR